MSPLQDSSVAGLVCRVVYSTKKSVFYDVSFRDFEARLMSCFPPGSGMAAQIVEQDHDDDDHDVRKESQGDEPVVGYDILLGFETPLSLLDITERFREFSGKVEGTLVGIAMDKSVDRTRWFLSAQWEDFRKPAMGSLGEVVFATGIVIWYTPFGPIALYPF